MVIPSTTSEPMVILSFGLLLLLGVMYMTFTTLPIQREMKDAEDLDTYDRMRTNVAIRWTFTAVAVMGIAAVFSPIWLMKVLIVVGIITIISGITWGLPWDSDKRKSLEPESDGVASTPHSRPKTETPPTEVRNISD